MAICEKCIHNSVCKYGEARSSGLYCTGEKCKLFATADTFAKSDTPADRYEFANVADDIFKNCKTIEDMCKIYVQLKKDLNGLFQQNVAFKSIDEQGE